MKTAILSLVLISSTAVAAEPEPLKRVGPDVISSARSEYNFQLLNDGNSVFARAEADFSEGKILFSSTVDGISQTPERITFSDERFKDSDPWLSADGSALYFIANRPTRAGETKDEEDYDIWRSYYRSGAWMAPERLPSVNSHSAEFGPEVHNEFLYFSSTREGGYYIYRSRLENGRPGEPELLPAPINSEWNDSDFTLSASGRVAVWCSTRPGGFGACDLYVSRLTETGWSDPENLGAPVNSDESEFSASLSPNGARLFFASSRHVDGQQEGAADVYEIAVADAPPLRDALAASALEQLKDAFGGHKALSTVETLAFTLETRREGKEPTSADYIYDFSRQAIMRRDPAAKTVSYVRGKNAVQIADGKETALSRSERASLQAGLDANFLSFLVHDDATLIGPLDIAGHGDLQWYRLSRGGKTSPPVALDPRTGRIVIVQIDDNRHVLETDYLPVGEGLIWPYRYIMGGGDKKHEGRFSNIRVNVSFPGTAPDWLQR